MSRNAPGAGNRPSEQMIRDRLKNRRSLYELERNSGSSLKRLKRSFMDESEDVSKAAPIWQRYPVRAFVAASCCSVLVLSAAVFIGNAMISDGSSDGAETARLAMNAKPQPSMPATIRQQDRKMAEVEITADSGPAVATPKVERLSASLSAPELAPPAVRERVTDASDASPPRSDERMQDDPGVDRTMATASIKRIEPAPDLPPISDRVRISEPSPNTAWADVFEDLTPATPAESQTPAPPREREPVIALKRGSALEALIASEPVVDAISPIEVPIPEPNPVTAETLTQTLPAPEIASLEEAQPKTIEGTAITTVNMRGAPEMDADILTVLSGGAPVDVLECNDWCHVRFENIEGYVYGTFIRTGSDEAAASGEG